MLPIKKKNKIKQTGVEVTGKNNVFINCEAEGFDKGIDLKETAEGNKFIDTNITTVSKLPKKKWYEKPLGIIFLMVVGGLIVGYLLYRFGWR